MFSHRQRNSLEASLERRVARAYHDYARFCSAHPNTCLSISVVLMLLLSYPALARFQMPNGSPVEVYRTSLAEPFDKSSSPDWFLRPPAMYVQQIIVRSKVRPWTALNLTAEHAVRGALSLSFPIRDILLHHLSGACMILRAQHASLITSSSSSSMSESTTTLLPSSGCLLLAPSAFWHHDKNKFGKDQSLAGTIFSPPCTPSMCVRDILLGMPTGQTGIKVYYQTNRERSISFAITVLLSTYDPINLSSMRSAFAAPTSNFTVVSSDEKTPYVHVFFRPRKHLTDYAPLLLAYLAFMIYVFFSASKFEMVSSRWGLALAAGGSVSFSLLMTAGLAAHLDLGPALWGGEIFPYLALILGLENILCITKSVVYTPPTLDVPSRLSLGLSSEGYSLTKYFVLEQLFLIVGYIAFPFADIKEFCTFASIGLIVDFYMQMFFYAPCLTFDLQALTEDEKKRFSRLLLNTDIPRLRHFPPVSCPFKRLFPRLFSPRVQIRRVHSETRVMNEGRPPTPNIGGRTHRRTASAHRFSNLEGDDIDLPINTARSKMVGILSFITRTRIIQRSIMVSFVAWTVWTALRSQVQFIIIKNN